MKISNYNYHYQIQNYLPPSSPIIPQPRLSTLYFQPILQQPTNFGAIYPIFMANFQQIGQLITTNVDAIWLRSILAYNLESPLFLFKDLGLSFLFFAQEKQLCLRYYSQQIYKKKNKIPIIDDLLITYLNLELTAEFWMLRNLFERGDNENMSPPIKFHSLYKCLPYLLYLQIMGKRAPKAEKNQSKKQEKKEEVSAEQAHFEVFTPKFYETLSSFQTFYKEVLALKSKEKGTDLSSQYRDVKKRVSEKLEETSNKILKEELADIQSWIEVQQQKIAGDTAKIEDAYKANSQSLANTGSFSDDEIRKQLQPIQAKIDEKNNTHQSYGQFLKKSKQIYQ